MSFEIVLKWQHLILLAGVLSAFYIFLKGYRLKGDSFGIGGIIYGLGGLIIFFFTLSVYLGLGYFGAFK